MRHSLIQNITLFYGWLLIFYALVWATAPYGQFDMPARLLLDVLAWPPGDNTPVWEPNIQWLSSIGAGLLFAIGVLFLGLIYPAVRDGKDKPVRIFVWAMMGWFVIDSAGSIAAGFAMNALLNLVTLLPILVPLVIFLSPKSANRRLTGIQ